MFIQNIQGIYANRDANKIKSKRVVSCATRPDILPWDQASASAIRPAMHVPQGQFK